MTDSITWTQINWYALGTFLLQVGFLIAAVWFAKNILRIIRSFQEQVGALLKLTIAPGSGERHAESANPKHSLGETSPYWLTPDGRPAVAEPVQSGPGLVASAWHGLGGATHRVGLWLQQPMGGNGVNPLRRAVRWLQSPAGPRSTAN